jgi:hypothetical protein
MGNYGGMKVATQINSAFLKMSRRAELLDRMYLVASFVRCRSDLRTFIKHRSSDTVWAPRDRENTRYGIFRRIYEI